MDGPERCTWLRAASDIIIPASVSPAVQQLTCFKINPPATAIMRGGWVFTGCVLLSRLLLLSHAARLAVDGQGLAGPGGSVSNEGPAGQLTASAAPRGAEEWVREAEEHGYRALAAEVPRQRPANVVWLGACTTIIIATYPNGTCKNLLPDKTGAGCNFTFIQGGTRALYDCAAAAASGAEYGALPPPGLQVGSSRRRAPAENRLL